ncbi:aspartyl/glutamyl-tRNA(Asn/Gln) amidotransferase, A subunit, variant 1 [Aphanomyces invadans]|uniref:Glutamyl-tRNA(Gln) amidotransferase subunit A, mitochondrial n=1 Tax=Aphanomyces invadans TaxID=157072 RepID=A0A024UP87_9STRA|nr:aspartyl/glutamyl-tRNA(Asn/Gln) amidotransferase, A subunit, variant 1 [Aphanomyces invadans]ETW07667.1 aspartyl/glutamyl-tRNA(Asn/Gln) amidotransferase, A subunit, variant 1 [Aphanomyces invadans]|eukprot:XP_008863760.1 aspartyl/glutamyl-tRNA(Asn/Gln) amidotransferase, A subunit, variant 1 [Aphanomyces invadans]
MRLVHFRQALRHRTSWRSVSSWAGRSLTDASEALANGTVTSVALTQACMDQIEATRGFNMFVATTFDAALEHAAEADKRRRDGRARGPLDGIPVGVKDIFCMRNAVPTTACSKILQGFVAPYESTATQRLLDAGAIPLGKLNMDEFAMGSGTTYSTFGPTINPWSKNLGEQALVAGGSSGASAAAVASGCCFAALGSDTGGSVRQPAAYCGVTGLKPNYGRISRHGMIAFASSLDTPGILTKTIRDASIVLQAIAGPDGHDSTALPDKLSSQWEAAASRKQLTVGVPKEYYVKELPETILKVWDQGIEWLQQAGVRVVETSLPTTKYALPTYYIIACAEASSNLSRYDGVRYGFRAELNRDAATDTTDNQANALHDSYCRTRSEGFGDEVQRRILSGTFVLSAGAFADYYERAVLVRQSIREDFAASFDSGVRLLFRRMPIAQRWRRDAQGMAMIHAYEA